MFAVTMSEIKKDTYLFRLRKFITELFIVSVIALMVGCSGSDSVFRKVSDGGGASETGNPGETIIAGYAQKGPFGEDSYVALNLYDENYDLTGTYELTQTDAVGNFNLEDFVNRSGYVQMFAEGYYFDEIAGEMSDGQLPLSIFTDLRGKQRININVLTTFADKRTLFLARTGIDFADAAEQARTEVLNIFGIDDPTATPFEEMNMLEDGDANGILLAVSTILTQMAHNQIDDESANELLSTYIIPDICDDIETDGILDDADLNVMIQQAIMTVDVAIVRSNFESAYPAYVIPSFEQYFIGALTIQWPDFNCAGNSISSVAVVISDVNTGDINDGPWPCTSLEGAITGLNAGEYDTVTINFIDAGGDTQFSVVKTAVTITANQTGIVTVMPGDFATGSVSFQWNIDCAATKVSTIEANFYDSLDTFIRSGGPWNCTDGQGSIESLYPVSNGKVILIFKDSQNNPLSQAEITSIDVLPFQDTVIGPFVFIPSKISAPLDGSTVFSGDMIIFTGSAYDYQGNPFTGTDLTWSSDIDGVIGTGESFSTNTLSQGTHTITLTSVDSVLGNISTTISLYISTMLYVGPGETYTTIQSAVDAAFSGDIIIVRDGIYTENVIVDKALKIKSENGYTTTTVIAASSTDSCFLVTSDDVSISGFTVYGATGDSSTAAGIYIDSADSCDITNNRCGYDASHNNNNGIVLIDSDNNIIFGNICNANISAGIEISFNSSKSEISNNTFNANQDGIFLGRGSAYNQIYANTLYGNTYGISMYELLPYPHDNSIYLNNFNNISGAVQSSLGVNNWASNHPKKYQYNGAIYYSQLGNYFHDHVLIDSDGDGITDTPYDLPANETIDPYPLVTTSDNYTGTEAVLVDFRHTFGLWFYNGMYISQISDMHMDGAIFWQNIVALDLGLDGLWTYDGNTLSNIHTWNPEEIIEFDNQLAIDFGTEGLWLYDGTVFSQLGSMNPENMCSVVDHLALDYGTDGTWYYYDSTINQIDTRNPEAIYFIGPFVIADFGTDGLWYYYYGAPAFINLSPWDSENVCHMDPNIYVDFGTRGLWSFYGGEFSLVSPWDPDDIDPTGVFLAIDFGVHGLWSYDGTTLYNIHDQNPEAILGMRDNAICIDFGANGFWVASSDPTNPSSFQYMNWDPMIMEYLVLN